MMVYFDNPQGIRDHLDKVQLESISTEVDSSSNFTPTLSDHDLDSIDHDLAKQIEATTEQAAINAYNLGFDAGERKGSDDHDKYTKENINHNLTDLIFNIVNGDKEAALSSLADICLDCGVYSEYKETRDKAEKVNQAA